MPDACWTDGEPDRGPQRPPHTAGPEFLGHAREPARRSRSRSAGRKPLTFLFLSLFAVTSLLLSGCGTGFKPDANVVAQDRDFLLVSAGKSDTLRSLAEKYLGDPSLDWVIAEANHIKTVKPGQEVVIPRRPLNRSAVFDEGYQTVPILTYHRFESSGDNCGKIAVSKAAFRKISWSKIGSRRCGRISTAEASSSPASNAGGPTRSSASRSGFAPSGLVDRVVCTRTASPGGEPVVSDRAEDALRWPLSLCVPTTPAGEAYLAATWRELQASERAGAE